MIYKKLSVSGKVEITFHKEQSTSGLTHLIKPEQILELFGSMNIMAPLHSSLRITIENLEPHPEYANKLIAYVTIEMEI